MNHHEWLAESFEANRPRLEAVAYRMLGSAAEAQDAVQESWLRLAASNSEGIDNLAGWLTTVVGRVCLDHLRSRKSRREQPIADAGPQTAELPSPAGNPESEAMLADSVGQALLVVLETLDPAERLAFVLHDMFAVPFDDIARIVDRSPAAARKLASRARHRVQGTSEPLTVDQSRQRQIVEAFLEAARGGDFDALVAVLDPDVVARSNGGSVGPIVRGVMQVAGGAMAFAPLATGSQLVLADGKVAALAGSAKLPTRVMTFTIGDDGRISILDAITDPDLLATMDLVVIGD
ncbi:sigma-70 family RNA polymerase sigma factor [Glycomyces buryatensis]|uniref:Sigma-70 family RNA polymerase sigma factor n=1 Tax=Glycomyces buryatensis TaxID=2570927 RepID=A0A4S8QBF7_9ACTN|nr:sigma-70 family RNA polymerase sigma factor [Glycomyces buryatensis]THV41688.1 sigma-70 family RNA polymerase sigma factor [Glycomyces buryatensis]